MTIPFYRDWKLFLEIIELLLQIYKIESVCASVFVIILYHFR